MPRPTLSSMSQSILLQAVIAILLACASVVVHLVIYLLWPPYWSQTSLQKFLTGAFARTLLKIIKAHKFQAVFGSVSLQQHLNSVVYQDKPVGFNVEAFNKCQWIHEVEDRAPDDPVIYYIHGGGFSLGITYPQIYWLTNLAKRLAPYRVSILALDYSLAPEFQYPTQLDEAIAGLSVLSESCNKIITLGDSAGGTLAAAMALKLQETSEIYGQVFISPWSELLPPRTGSVLANKKLDWINEAFAVSCVGNYTGFDIDQKKGKLNANYEDRCMDLVYATVEDFEGALAPRRACVWSGNELLADACERFVQKSNIKQTHIEEGALHDIMYFSANGSSGFDFVVETIGGWLREDELTPTPGSVFAEKGGEDDKTPTA